LIATAQSVLEDCGAEIKFSISAKNATKAMRKAPFFSGADTRRAEFPR
jgi:hypothetical protein